MNSSFIGEFKTGDNIVYNLAILWAGYAAIVAAAGALNRWHSGRKNGW